MIGPNDLAVLLPDFIVRQRWYGANDLELSSVEVTDSFAELAAWPVAAGPFAAALPGAEHAARTRTSSRAARPGLAGRSDSAAEPRACPLAPIIAASGLRE